MCAMTIVLQFEPITFYVLDGLTLIPWYLDNNTVNFMRDTHKRVSTLIMRKKRSETMEIDTTFSVKELELSR